ncbi:multi-sensor signal transduction histidine kinase [Calothrix sp. NIES-4071]|nr:multi-sensor signal transduction histidine kinase [Calothrix sp. NIES-4071]BAZ61463.1 multi-sensor signal transduction histidine kinase [Calothrix sp. NIES-4105]
MKKLSKLKKLTAVFGVAASVVVNQALQFISQEFNNTQISFNHNDFQYINLLKQNLLIVTFGNVGILVLFYLLLRTLIHLELTERKLARTENRLQALIDVSECVELIAKDTTLLEINANGIKMMKADNANELVGKRVDTRVEHEYVTAFTALHESVCRGNSETLEFEINIQGTRRWVKTRAVPLLDEDGTFLNLSVTRDITEEKQLFEQLLRFQRLDTIGCLAGGIAHDLNNVLSAILLSVQLLRMKLPNNQYQNLITTLENNVKRGANLIKQVLLFARGVDKQTVIDLKTILSEVELFITQTFPKSIETKISISPYIGCVIGNTTQIHQVLMNLLVNARDAMPQGGKLTLTASHIIEDQESNFIVITVTDTGIGIPPSIIERIFEPFFTTKEVGKGTGLGLSTTKTIIKNHGGFIDVCSKVGEGTSFKVYLPALTSKQIDTLPFKILSKDLMNKVLINSQ